MKYWIVKKLLAAALPFLLAAALVCSASAAEERQYVYDGEGWLTEAECNALESEIRAMSERSDANYYLFTLDLLYGLAREQADDYVCGLYGIDQRADNVILVVTKDSDGFHYDLFTHGRAGTRISDAEVERILYHEGVYDPIIEDGELAEGLHGFLAVAETAYDGLLWAPIGKTVLISVLMGVTLAGIVTVAVISSYKKKLHSVAYPLEAYTRLELTHSKDIFLTKHVTRVRINTGSSGGGGRGGGGGHRGGV